MEIIKGIPETLKEIVKFAPTYYDRKNWFYYHNRQGGEHYLITCKLIFDAEKSKDWKHDGSGAKNFFHWVEGELKIKRSDAQRRKAIWEGILAITGDKMDLILSIDTTKLSIVAPLLIGLPEEEQEDLLHQAKENTVRDLEDNIRGMKGLPQKDTCLHDGEIKKLEICKICKKVLYNSDFEGR